MVGIGRIRLGTCCWQFGAGSTVGAVRLGMALAAMELASVLTGRAGSYGVPWAVARGLLSGPLRLGPVDGSARARCSCVLRGLTTATVATVVVVAVVPATMAAAMGRSRGGGAD